MGLIELMLTTASGSALAARLMHEAIPFLVSYDRGVTSTIVDYMREFIRSYEHVIGLRRQT